jgi:hypothetical protein
MTHRWIIFSCLLLLTHFACLP